MNWLDTETKAILQQAHDPKLAPPKAAEFSLVLLRKGTDFRRLVRAIRRINNCTETKAIDLVRSSVPVIINADLTEEDALFGQFELVCCDAVSAFIRSEALASQDQTSYLQTIFEKVAESPEFRPTKMEVVDVPATEAGQNFLDQFLGMPLFDDDIKFPRLSVWIPFKKAKVMAHWAARVGAQVRCVALGNETAS